MNSTDASDKLWNKQWCPNCYSYTLHDSGGCRECACFNEIEVTATMLKERDK